MFLSSDEDKIIGAIFPILPKHVPALFGGNRDVFVKFTKFTLKEDMTIIFYVCGKKKLVGNGKIKSIEKMSPERAWSQYKGRIFLDKIEYYSYAKTSPISGEARKMNEIMVFTLTNMRKYKKPLSSLYPITPSGRYLSRKIESEIK